MKNNKLALNLALLSTAVTGVLVGALIVNKPNVDENTSSYAANSTQTQVQTTAQKTYTSDGKTDIAEKLSKDFITISKDVTPAIVSIYSTKIVKQKSNYHEFLNDPYLRRFFNNPNNPHGKNFGLDPNDGNSREQGLGSGVIVDKTGIILTNNHVVEGADDINVTLSDKRRYKAKIIGTDPKTDVAVIKLEKGKDLPVAKLGNSNNIQVGEWVLAIGNPLGLSSTVTSGIISAKGRADVGVADFEDFIQTDAAINPGNSGGALVNLQGEVIGINTAIASRTGGYMGIGFAIPSNMAKKVMNDLVSKGRVTRGFLGIQIQNINDSIAKRLKIGEGTTGIIVGEVTNNSPAQKAGIQPYDVIIELNGNKVNDVSTFRNNIASNDPGQTVKLGIVRDGKKIIADVKLGELDTVKASTQQSAPEQDTSSIQNLGFNIESLTPEILKELGIKNTKTKGVVITSIDPSSSASEAGLMRGDIIQEMNREKINNEADYKKVSKDIKSGDSVLLKVLRDSQPLLLAFTYQK